tara:strand:- start:558 stop:1010 length:453 start_codon:yes stop_codon:yes gene_type:complete
MPLADVRAGSVVVGRGGLGIPSSSRFSPSASASAFAFAVAAGDGVCGVGVGTGSSEDDDAFAFARARASCPDRSSSSPLESPSDSDEAENRTCVPFVGIARGFRAAAVFVSLGFRVRRGFDGDPSASAARESSMTDETSRVRRWCRELMK